MELRVGRPQKPFVVEVKRGRKGVASGRSNVLPKSLAGLSDAKVEARKPARPPATLKEAAKPPRRILDALDQELAPMLDPAVEVAATVAVDPPKRRRGRPVKAAHVPAVETERQVVVRKPVVLPKPVSVRKPVAVQKPVAVRKEEAPVARRARHEFLYAPENIVVLAAPLREPKAAPRAHGHVTHGDRVEEAGALPRGERWKRRLPKVLW
jgi:hypothetical protein